MKKICNTPPTFHSGQFVIRNRLLLNHPGRPIPAVFSQEPTIMKPFDESPFDAAAANPDSSGDPTSASDLKPPKASIAMATPKHLIDLGDHLRIPAGLWYVWLPTPQNPQIKKIRYYPCIRNFARYGSYTDAQSVSPGPGLKRCASSSNRQTRRKAGTQSHGSSGFLNTRGIARLPKG
jgi:hypothetical protein